MSEATRARPQKARRSPVAPARRTRVVLASPEAALALVRAVAHVFGLPVATALNVVTDWAVGQPVSHWTLDRLREHLGSLDAYLREV